MGRNKHSTKADRAVIKTLRNEGYTLKEIAAKLNCSIKRVFTALQPEKLVERRGKPQKLTISDKRLLVRKSKADPYASSKDLKRLTSLPVSARTIRRVLKDNNLNSRTARKVPCLTKRHRQKRLQFSQTHKIDSDPSEAKKYWRNVLWSDETKINLFGMDGRHFVRRPPGEAFNPKYTRPTVKHGGGSIMIWGCFSWYGVGPIYRIDGIMNKEVYLDILQNTMQPWADENMPLKWKFQQDNDPKHTAKVTKQWFITNKIDVLEWPSQSPDLNPIEHLWQELKVGLAKTLPSNKDELWREVQKAWYSIPIKKCRTLVESMPNRLKEVSKNNGFSTRY